MYKADIDLLPTMIFSLYYFLFDLLARIARELAADFVKSTDPRLRRLSSDILTKRSAAEPCNVGIAFTFTAISSKDLLQR